jgi:hypothetical protein
MTMRDLIRHARETTNEWKGQPAILIEELADALEKSEARLAKAREALESIAADHGQFARERAQDALKELG